MMRKSSANRDYIKLYYQVMQEDLIVAIKIIYIESQIP